MCLKHYQKYVLIFIVMLVIVTPFFIYIVPTTIQNETVYIPFTGLRIRDPGAYVALIVGLLAFVGTIYNTDKTFEVTKLSSIPDYSVNLLIDLEFAFNEFEDDDKLIFLTEILKYWKDHQKAFRLLTPHFYKNFLKIISHNEKIKDNDSIAEINSKYVMMAIKAQINDVAFENEKNIFSFIKPELIKDDKNISDDGENLENYLEFEIEKTNFEKYINDFEGKETQNKTFNKFNKFYNEINDLLNDLKKEIGEYD